MEKIIFSILKTAVKAISPQLRAQITGLYNSLKKAADSTDNQFDDLLVAILGALLDIDN